MKHWHTFIQDCIKINHYYKHEEMLIWQGRFRIKCKEKITASNEFLGKGTLPLNYYSIKTKFSQ